MIDYIIVGQGIAGTLLSFELIKEGHSVIIIDNPELSQCSRVAAGIINPITGRKFVKTWMYEDLEAVFVNQYEQISKFLGETFLVPKTIYRAIHSIKDQNNWDAKSLDTSAARYMSQADDIGGFDEVVKRKLGYGKVKGYQLKIEKLINAFRNYLIQNNILLEETFDFGQLKIEEKYIRYKDFQAKGIVFCEGHKVKENPYFQNQPFTPTKGELLLVKIPNLKTKDFLKDGVFIVPMEDDLYWIGGTYAWDEFNDIPSEDKKAWLIKALETAIDVPYEIVDHQAGVRPASKYRRPLMGRHVQYPHIYLFNGLGTKGSSLGPYWAKRMSAFILEEVPLPKEVSI